MFSRVSLHESFRHVASSKDWATFSSFGDVQSIDLWLNSLAADGSASRTSKLDGYEPLWARLAEAVRGKLAAGLWKAEGFDPGRGPQPQQIDAQLWRSLKFEIQDGSAAGAGFKFVNLLISSDERCADQSMFEHWRTTARPVRLANVLDLVATEAEAAEYASLKEAADAPLMWISGAPESAYERQHRLCCELQGKLWARLLPRLVSGELAGEGLMSGSVEPTSIPARLWPELRCIFSRDEVFTVGGPNLHFFHVTISRRKPERSARADIPGAVRRRLVNWIKEEAAAEKGPIRKAHLLEAARSAFPNDQITRNLFAQALAQAAVPDGFLFKGRPKR